MHQHITPDQTDRLIALARELAGLRGTIYNLPRLRAIRREYAELKAQEQQHESRR